jgi:hypothetical protein
LVGVLEGRLIPVARARHIPIIESAGIVTP